MSGRSKRIAKVAAEVEEGLAAARKLEQVAGLPDDKLFFEDKGAQSRRRPGKAKPVATSPSSALTAGAGLAAPVLPAQYIVAKPVKSSKVTAVVPVPAPAPVAPPAGEQLYDAWEEDEGAPAKKKFIPQLSKVAKVPAVVLPHPGTSYNPSVDDHQV